MTQLDPYHDQKLQKLKQIADDAAQKYVVAEKAFTEITYDPQNILWVTFDGKTIHKTH